MIGLIAGSVAAAFFIWLTVRACNRRERWAITLAEGLAAGAVLIALASQAAPEMNGYWWSAVCAVAFSPDGNTLAAGHFDGKAYNEDFHYRIRDLSQSVALFDAKTGTNSRALTQVRDPGPYSGFAVTPFGTFVAFSPDGSMLAIGSYDGWVQLRDLRSGMFKQTLTPQSSRLKAVAFSKDGKKLIAAGSFVTVWDTVLFSRRTVARPRRPVRRCFGLGHEKPQPSLVGPHERAAPLARLLDDRHECFGTGSHSADSATAQ
jgi:hypothetical protein